VRPAPGRGGKTAVRTSLKLFTVLALAIAVGLATAVSPFASSSPDGLERVAQDQAFIDDGRRHGLQEDAPVPDYALPGIGDARLATGLAGFLGTLVVFAAGFGVATLLRARAGRAPVS
jgi:hypothetical protein